MTRIHALAEPLAVGAIAGALAGNITSHEPLSAVIITALALLVVVTAAKAVLAYRIKRRSKQSDHPAYRIDDVFDQVHAMWADRGTTTVTIHPDRDPNVEYIGRHRRPELAAA